MDKFAVLHIGMPKVGSSSLQKVLSRFPIFSKQGEPRKFFEYVALTEQGQLLDGETVQKLACLDPAKYVTSDSFEKLSRQTSGQLDAQGKRLDDVFQSGRVPVLSNEGWSDPENLDSASRVLEHLQITPVCVLFIRPPVEWANSLRLQWGLSRTDAEQQEMVIEHLKRYAYDRVVGDWQTLVGADNVLVRLGSGGVVRQFTDALGAARLPELQANVGLTATLASIVKRYPQLWPDADAPYLKWAIDSLSLQCAEEPAWTLDRNDVERTINDSRPTLLRMLELLPPGMAELIKGDQRWWSVEPYAERAENAELRPSGRRPSATALEALCVELLDAIIRKDSEAAKVAWESTFKLRMFEPSQDLR